MEGKEEKGGWEGVFKRVVGHEDDGHACKLVRALRHGEEICRPYDNNNNNNNGDDPRFRIKGGMWLKLGHMGECVSKLPRSSCVRDVVG